MGYIESTLVPVLKHVAKSSLLSQELLESTLWYTTTKESYIQRTEEFDGSWLIKSNANDYVALLLKSQFSIPDLIIYDDSDDCKIKINSLTANDLNENLLYVYIKDDSLFTVFWDKIRNAFAHGTFNKWNGRYYLLNQAKAKIISPPNFLLQTDSNVDAVIKTLWQDFKLALTSPDDFKYLCLKDALSLEKTDDGYFSLKEQRYIVIDDTFKFAVGSGINRTEQIQQYFQEFDSDKKIDIIVNENVGNLSDDKLVSESGMLRMVPQSRLIQCYKISGTEKIKSTKSGSECEEK